MSEKNNDELNKVVDFLKGFSKDKEKPQPNEDGTIPLKPKKPVNYKSWLSAGAIITGIFALLIIAFANLYIVKENEYKVIRQFGEVVKFEKKPGLYIKVPFIQTVTTLPSNQLTYDNVSQEEINTKDKKRIIIDNYAIWRITDPKQLITNAGTMVNAETRMQEFMYSVIRNELGQLNYTAVINDESSSRGSLNDTITKRVNELLEKDKYGIEVIDIRIRRLDLPSENEQAVYQRMVSDRQSDAQKYISEGDAAKHRIEAQTDREVQEMLATAKKEAAVITAEGEAEAARIYNESFAKDPEFYSLYRTLESYKRTIGEDTMIVLPSNSPYASLLSGYIK